MDFWLFIVIVVCFWVVFRFVLVFKVEDGVGRVWILGVVFKVGRFGLGGWVGVGMLVVSLVLDFVCDDWVGRFEIEY